MFVWNAAGETTKIQKPQSDSSVLPKLKEKTFSVVLKNTPETSPRPISFSFQSNQEVTASSSALKAPEEAEEETRRATTSSEDATAEVTAWRWSQNEMVRWFKRTETLLETLRCGKHGVPVLFLAGGCRAAHHGVRYMLPVSPISLSGSLELRRHGRLESDFSSRFPNFFFHATPFRWRHPIKPKGLWERFLRLQLDNSDKWMKSFDSESWSFSLIISLFQNFNTHFRTAILPI